MFICLLSGLFCCLGFSVVFFLLFGRGPNSKKNKHASAPSDRFFWLLFGRAGVSFFCCLGGGVLFFLLFGVG